MSRFAARLGVERLLARQPIAYQAVRSQCNTRRCRQLTVPRGRYYDSAFSGSTERPRRFLTSS